MIVETAWLSHVALHDDDRISMTKSMPREGVFLHIDFTEKELEALQKVLATRLDRQSNVG